MQYPTKGAATSREAVSQLGMVLMSSRLVTFLAREGRILPRRDAAGLSLGGSGCLVYQSAGWSMGQDVPVAGCSTVGSEAAHAVNQAVNKWQDIVYNTDKKGQTRQKESESKHTPFHDLCYVNTQRQQTAWFAPEGGGDGPQRQGEPAG